MGPMNMVARFIVVANLMLLLSGRSVLSETVSGVDPACAAPGRGSAVWVARAKAAKSMRQKQGLMLRAESVSPVTLGLNWDFQRHLPELHLRGPARQIARIETTTALGKGIWESLLTVTLPAEGVDWKDSVSGPAATRFYRLASLGDAPPAEEADDFLLLDHTGAARELFYPSNLKALVVATAGDSIEQLDSVVAALTPLAQSLNTNEVRFWVLVHDVAAARTNVAARIQKFGSNIPVLLDPERLGAMALRLTHAGEVTVVQPPTFTIAYRGQLDLSATTAGGQPYLAAALDGVKGGGLPDFLQTPLGGTRLALTTDVPDFARDIAPIFHRHCAICHQPNDVAPFAMTNYETVASWAPAIKHAVLSGEMPPWHVDPEYGRWSNSLALPPMAKSTLVRWVNAGAPRGKGNDPLAEQPVPASFRRWPTELGEPDVIVTPGEQAVKAFGVEPYRYISVQAPNPTSVWLRAAVILPSSPAIVHHYLVWPSKVGNLSKDPDVSTYETSLAEYVPGVAPYIYPADSGVLLSRSNWLTFNLHYTPNGEVTNDLPKLALWYHKAKPRYTYHLEGGFANGTFRIPPNNAEYPVSVPPITLDHSIRIHRFNPHMHLRGKRMSFEAIYPNGMRETLLSVPDYDFRWQVGYQLAEPKTLPANTRLLIRGAFDNSAQNLANPDPSATVIWGDQTTREMFVGFVDYVD